MDGESLVRVSLKGGRYEGLLTSETPAGVEAVYDGAVVAQAEITPNPAEPDSFRVALSLPVDVISEGVQVINLRSAVNGAILDKITLMAGEALDEDIRAEIALLRDELELLKRAFRRHAAGQ